MKQHNVSTIAILIVAALSLISFVPMLSDDFDADSDIVVTDGFDREFTFTDTPSKIVTIGAGFTSTAIDLGLLDQIIVADKYSKSNTDEMFDGLREKIDAGDIRANGSAYSSGLSDIKADILTMTEALSLADGTNVTDVAIFISGSSTQVETLYADLTSNLEYKYKYVLCWTSADSYDIIIDMAKTMSLVMKGYVDDKVKNMELLVDYIDEVLSDDDGLVRREAFYVNYSGGELKVGNIGSLANSMIHAAGGISVTEDPSKASTYGANITFLLEQYGADVVLFVDNTLATNETYMGALRTAIGSQDVKLVHLDPLWNNFCIRSMDGVWAMACAMYADQYPDIFTGDVPDLTTEDEDNFALYITIGVVCTVAILILAFVYFRK